MLDSLKRPAVRQTLGKNRVIIEDKATDLLLDYCSRALDTRELVSLPPEIVRKIHTPTKRMMSC